MRYVLIYSLLFIHSSLFAQDSLKLYPVVKWKLDRLLDISFYDYPKCETALLKSSQAIDSLKYALQKGTELVDLRTIERDLKAKETDLWQKRFENQNALQKVEIKKQRAKGNKKGIVGIGLGFLIALILL